MGKSLQIKSRNKKSMQITKRRNMLLIHREWNAMLASVDDKFTRLKLAEEKLLATKKRKSELLICRE
jgi:hypothetical protein